MALLDEVKVALRVTSSAMDDEINNLINAALADMSRVGVADSMLDEDSMDALAKMAVMLYTKAHFGYDNDEASRFDESYRQVVVDMLNSPGVYGAGAAATAAEEAEEDTDTSTDVDVDEETDTDTETSADE